MSEAFKLFVLLPVLTVVAIPVALVLGFIRLMRALTRGRRNRPTHDTRRYYR